MTETEYKILNWRGGSINAERMCADILIMQDYESVDPQSPLGGPDGTKDILCKKSGWKYVVAVYFAPLPKIFRSVKSKFISDYEGVKKNNVDGIIFMTNQKLTPTNKKNLKLITKEAEANCIIYDNEVIRGLLDSAMGLPIRLQHLKIKLSKEDQIAFFSKQHNRLSQLFDSYSNSIIEALSFKIAECCESNEQKLDDECLSEQRTMSHIGKLPPASDKSKLSFPTSLEISTKNLNSETLRFIHKIMLYDSSSIELGEYRSHMIWVGSPKSAPEKAAYIPPKPEFVAELTESLLQTWRSKYNSMVKTKKKSTIIEKIAWFHSQFLSVHPFLDGNGRIARFLLNQQVSELLNINKQLIIEDRPSYFDALNEGQKGNLQPLIKIITQSVYGDETI